MESIRTLKVVWKCVGMVHSCDKKMEMGMDGENYFPVQSYPMNKNLYCIKCEMFRHANSFMPRDRTIKHVYMFLYAWDYYLRLVFRLAVAWQFVLRKARAERCSALSWMLFVEPSLVRRSRINWIWRSCVTEMQAEHKWETPWIRWNKRRQNQYINKQGSAFDPPYQLLAIRLSLLSAPDLHIYLVAGVFQFDLQGSPLRLRFGERLFARPQLLLGPLPFATTVIKVLCHLDEVWETGCAYNKNVAGICIGTSGICLKR